MPRTIAIGDIHGCANAFSALLDAIQVRSTDTIVTLGDYIDRGPDSRGVLERLIELDKQCTLVPILGNHDQMLLDVRDGKYPIFWFLDIGGVATLKSYGGDTLDKIPKTHISFIRSCRDYYETETHIFAHANYFPDMAMDEQPPGILRWESLREMTPGPHESGKTVILGHTSQKTGEILDLGHLICIDTFCCGGGWLTALEVGSGQVWQVNDKSEVRK